MRGVVQLSEGRPRISLSQLRDHPRPSLPGIQRLKARSGHHVLPSFQAPPLALGTSTLGTSGKSGRSPVSRILSLPPLRDWAIISLPACAGARLRGTATNTRGYDGRATLPLFCLAPRGVCRAAPVARTRGGLLPHPFTLTPLRRGYGGRYTLCCTFRPAALTLPSPSFERHVALRCPDFPRPCGEARPRSPGERRREVRRRSDR